MSILPPLLRSLLLTAIFSFLTPWIFVGLGLSALGTVRSIPAFADLGDSGVQLILKFLEIFGSGHPIQGLLVLSLTYSLVSTLFDAFAPYRYHNLRGD